MSSNPTITAREWRAISAHLKPSKTGRPRSNDRRDLARLLWAVAIDEALQRLYGRAVAARLIVKRHRLKETGAWDRIELAAEPVIGRMRTEAYESLAADPLVKHGIIPLAGFLR